jgi:hypothetical protein
VAATQNRFGVKKELPPPEVLLATEIGNSPGNRGEVGGGAADNSLTQRYQTVNGTIGAKTGQETSKKFSLFVDNVQGGAV